MLWDRACPEGGWNAGNGIVFEHPTPHGIRWAIESALELYGQPETWKQIVANAQALAATPATV